MDVCCATGYGNQDPGTAILADMAFEHCPMSVDLDLERRRAILRDARDITIRIRNIAATMPDSSSSMQCERDSRRS
jgi:hypothetical protein